MEIMLGISLKNFDVLLKYLSTPHSHLQKKMMLFKSKIVDEVCVYA